MVKFYGLDVLNTRRYVLQDLDNAPDKLKATIEAATIHDKNDDMQALYGYDPISEFIEGSLKEISHADIVSGDMIIGRDGHYPSDPYGKPTNPPGAKYYAILTKHQRCYIVGLDEDAESPLEATIELIKKFEEDGSWSACFQCGHVELMEFDKNSFRKASPDEDGPTVVRINFNV